MQWWIKRWFSRGAEAPHLQQGKWGERQALRFLKDKGFRIVACRVRIGKHDEIDIVAIQNGVLLFVEVKTRKDETHGRPFAAVNKDKRKRLSRGAVAYLKKQRLRPDYLRFDVVEVVGERGGQAPEIRHIENAFQLDPSCKLWW